MTLSPWNERVLPHRPELLADSARLIRLVLLLLWDDSSRMTRPQKEMAPVAFTVEMAPQGR